MTADENTPTTADETTTTTTTTTTTIETNVAPTVQPEPAPAPSTGGETTAIHHDLAQWHGKRLIDRDGEKIGKLENVYVDADTDEPQFGTVKEGHFGRHLTFVPLDGATIGPDGLQVVVSRQQVQDAPNIDMHGDELSEEGESALYHHYQLNYTPRDTHSGRRLVRR
jgi:sporulation protein YlmC with PRC-barrel domain